MSSTTCPSSSSFTVATCGPGEPGMITTTPAIPTVARMDPAAQIRLQNQQPRWSEAEPHWYGSRISRCELGEGCLARVDVILLRNGWM